MGEGNDMSDGGPQMRGGLHSEPVEHDREERHCKVVAWGVPTHWQDGIDHPYPPAFCSPMLDVPASDTRDNRVD
jgi:hypothetical protein